MSFHTAAALKLPGIELASKSGEKVIGRLRAGWVDRESVVPRLLTLVSKVNYHTHTHTIKGRCPTVPNSSCNKRILFLGDSRGRGGGRKNNQDRLIRSLKPSLALRSTTHWTTIN